MTIKDNAFSFKTYIILVPHKLIRNEDKTLTFHRNMYSTLQYLKYLIKSYKIRKHVVTDRRINNKSKKLILSVIDNIP